jgi:hypothetical protein
LWYVLDTKITNSIEYFNRKEYNDFSLLPSFCAKDVKFCVSFAILPYVLCGKISIKNGSSLIFRN